MHLMHHFKCQMYALRCQNAFCNIFQMASNVAQLNIFQRKMYAEHFPLENVRQNAFCRFQNAASNAFWHQMHFCIKCILASNAFLHQMHFGIKCIFASNAFLHQMHFCTAEHFPKENVMRCVAKMHFAAFAGSIKCILASNAFLQSKAKC